MPITNSLFIKTNQIPIITLLTIVVQLVIYVSRLYSHHAGFYIVLMKQGSYTAVLCRVQLFGQKQSRHCIKTGIV